MDKCVYLHKDKEGVVRYVGQGSENRAYEFSKTKRSTAWFKVFNDEYPTVEIVAKKLDVNEANSLESRLISEHRNTCCNIRPVTVPHDMTYEEMDEWFYIDPECPSGLRWKKQRPRSRSRAGDQAGSILQKTNNKKYWQVKLFDTVFKVHRIVYLLKNGSIDRNKVVDHIDGDGTNNKVENLRLVTYFENAHNKVVSQNKKLSVKNVKESRRFYFGVFEVMGEIVSLKVEKKDYPDDKSALSYLVQQIEDLRQKYISNCVDSIYKLKQGLINVR